MVEVRTREEAINSVDKAFAQWGPNLVGILTQASATSGAAETHASDVVRRCATRVAALEALLSAAAGEERRRVEVELAKARESRARAERARARIAALRSQVATLARTHTAESTSRVGAARATLARMSQSVQLYRGGAIAHDAAFGATAAAPGTASSDPLEPLGLQDVSVEAADLEDSPIVGGFGRGGTTRSDYRWAVQTWADLVEPGIRRGMTRVDFAQRDTDNASPPLRRAADVYDLFLGSDRIRVDQRPDGSLDVVNGRHRLAIARELGIRTLPGQVS